MRKRPWIVHPFLLAAFPILYLYAKNLKTVGAAEVCWPLALSLAASALAFGILRAARVDGPRAGLVVSSVVILFFSFGHAIRLLGRLGLGPAGGAREAFVVLMGSGVLGLVIVLFRKRPGLAATLTDACNASAVALAAMTAAAIVLPDRGGPSSNPTRVAVPPSARSRASPDVYLVVLDAYGRSEILKDALGYDNSSSLDRLRARGFVIGESSRSNYCQTALSLAATLNLRYLDDLAGDPTDDRRPLRRLIAENATFRAFRDRGYRLVTFASGFDATESFEADLSLAPPGHLRTFHAMIADQTPLWLFAGQAAWREPHRLHRERTLKVFDELPAACHPDDRPTLTFTHVVSPHPPFVFGHDGRDVSGREASYAMSDSEGWRAIAGHEGPDDYARRYRDQATYLTSRLEEVVEQILATSKTPPVILILGDHGPGAHFDSGADRPNHVAERFGILNACYLPGGSASRVATALTPINAMRALLDACLGTDLGPIADRSYYSTYAKPYVFTEVTAELDRPFSD